MQQPPINHQLASLLLNSDFIGACNLEGAPNLRRIVEAQSAEIVKLRRALETSNAISNDRLDIIQNLTGAEPEGSPNSLKQILKNIHHLESDIYSIINKSKWRKLGIKLGLESRLEWESGPWRSRLSTNSQNPDIPANLIDNTVNFSFALSEQKRLALLWLKVSQSRWRRVGIKLRVAQELPMDMPLNKSYKHALQFNSIEPHHGEPQYQQLASASSGYQAFVEYTRNRFLYECKSFAVDVIFDVGANTGQFARGIRASGYVGQIFSFEPLSTAHAELLLNAHDDMLWHIVDRCAVGSENSTAKINIAGNSYSSSILPMMPLHEEAAPESVYLDCEECPVVTLESFIEHAFPNPSMSIGLKIDTQGYEHRVIEGLGMLHPQIKVIVCEMSLRPLYENSVSMPDLCRQLSCLGFRCVALGPEYEHPSTGELLQVDGVFIRK